MERATCRRWLTGSLATLRRPAAAGRRGSRTASRGRAMSAGWVAASVRARAMARRRVGLARGAPARRGAGPGGRPRPARRDRLCGGRHGTSRRRARGGQRAVADATLWQIRVLAGWLPSSGTVLARAAAAGFERENLVAHLEPAGRTARRTAVRAGHAVDGVEPGAAHDVGRGGARRDRRFAVGTS